MEDPENNRSLKQPSMTKQVAVHHSRSKWTIALFLMSVCAMAISSVTIWIYYEKMVASNEDIKICVTCKVFFNKRITNPYIEDVSRRALDQGNEKCCGENINELTAMVEYLMPEQQNSDGLRENNVQMLTGSHIGAHKHLQVNEPGPHLVNDCNYIYYGFAMYY